MYVCMYVCMYDFISWSCDTPYIDRPTFITFKRAKLNLDYVCDMTMLARFPNLPDPKIVENKRKTFKQSLVDYKV
jgi:hypothetical protein